MKKILMTLFTVFVVFSAGAIVSAGTTEEEPDFKLPDLYESGDYEYKKANDHKTVIITAYNGKEESIEIPSELDGYPVSGIGYQAFTYLKMNGLSIPESVRTIGSRAFEYCTIRDSLVLPEQVTIEQDAFSYAVLPSVLTIPAGAVAAEDSFSYCEHVNRLMISPDAVIKDGAFGYCDDLLKVVCAEGSRLEKEGFEYCRSLEEVLLCGEVELEEEAFSHCDRAVVTKTDAAAFDNQDDNQDDNQGDDDIHQACDQGAEDQAGVADGDGRRAAEGGEHGTDEGEGRAEEHRAGAPGEEQIHDGADAGTEQSRRSAHPVADDRRNRDGRRHDGEQLLQRGEDNLSELRSVFDTVDKIHTFSLLLFSICLLFYRKRP